MSGVPFCDVNLVALVKVSIFVQIELVCDSAESVIIAKNASYKLTNSIIETPSRLRKDDVPCGGQSSL